MENMDLLDGLYRLHDEMDKISVSGIENAVHLAMCGELLHRIISVFQSAANALKEESGKECDKNAGTTETDKRAAESGCDGAK